MLASTLPRLPAARKPLNPCGIHPKRAGTAWDASRPWCGGLRPMPQPTVERLEPGARALQNLNTNLIQFNTNTVAITDGEDRQAAPTPCFESVRAQDTIVPRIFTKTCTNLHGRCSLIREIREHRRSHSILRVAFLHRYRLPVRTP